MDQTPELQASKTRTEGKKMIKTKQDVDRKDHESYNQKLFPSRWREIDL